MRVLIDSETVDRGIREMAETIAERTRGASGLVLVGVRRGGIPVASRLVQALATLLGRDVPLGTVDITFYRDDAATALPNPRIGPTELPGTLEGRHVILVDDVLFTGRTIRAALDALLDYGRPKKVELAVLVDRGGRELPIQADYRVRTAKIDALDRVDVIDDNGMLGVYIQSQDMPTRPPRAEGIR